MLNKSKLFVSFLLGLEILTWTTRAHAVRLIDVPEQNPAYKSVQLAIERYKLFKPYPDQTFRGKTPFTRYQLAEASFQALQYLKQLPQFQIESPLNQFGYYRLFLQENGGDLPSRHWAVRAIQELLAHGLMSSEDNFFRGAKKVTRYELAAQIFAFFKWLNLDAFAPDTNQRPVIARDIPQNHWAHPAVTALLEKGILTLDAQGDFKGNVPASQYELASSMVNALKWIEAAPIKQPIRPKDPVLPKVKGSVRRDGRILF
jgi:hypothetical protein